MDIETDTAVGAVTLKVGSVNTTLDMEIKKSFQYQNSYQHFNPNAQSLPPQAAFQQQPHGTYFRSSGINPNARVPQQPQPPPPPRFSFTPGRDSISLQPRSLPPQLAHQVQGYMQQRAPRITAPSTEARPPCPHPPPSMFRSQQSHLPLLLWPLCVSSSQRH